MPGMRRKDKEITDKSVIEEVLRENDVGRLAMAVDNQPYVVPLNYLYHGGKIYFHSHKDGTKMGNIVKNPRVCFEVDSGEIVKGEKPCDFTWKYMSAIVKGKASIVTDPAKKLNILKLISDKYSPGKGKLLTEEDMAKNPQLAIVEIAIEEMTGKRSPVKPPQ
jgi:nitroimidazol reductase NimA-like FMN-containing flavoprotein (pyridoxamine 5'-phosphate oxidase superfamily)